MEWLKMWDEKANTENYFTQTGRGKSFTMFEFLLYIQDVQASLQLCKDDNLLDAGCGPCWTTMHFSPFVKWVVAFDYSKTMIEKAREQTKAFSNITAFQLDILKMEQSDGGFHKVLVGSVLQYLNNIDEVKQAMQNIYNVMEPGGTALFTHNPDASKKESHLTTIKPENMQIELARLWLDFDEIYDIAMSIGFRSCRKLAINLLIWQSGHMFDFVLKK